jgi:hypothetical protein
MTKKEKIIILLGLACLADRFNIKDNEIATEAQHERLNAELEINENMFNDKELFKQQVIGMTRKYINNL